MTEVCTEGRLQSGSDRISMPRLALILGEEDFDLKVVGTSRRQRDLQSIAGDITKFGANHVCGALLVPQPDNDHGQVAVAVDIDGHLVGYLDDDAAALFNRALAVDGFEAAACAAKIVGGWHRGKKDREPFGVRLAAIIPFILEPAPATVPSLEPLSESPSSTAPLPSSVALKKPMVAAGPRNSLSVAAPSTLHLHNFEDHPATPPTWRRNPRPASVSNSVGLRTVFFGITVILGIAAWEMARNWQSDWSAPAIEASDALRPNERGDLLVASTPDAQAFPVPMFVPDQYRLVGPPRSAPALRGRPQSPVPNTKRN